jgi:hypothetical protein
MDKIVTLFDVAIHENLNAFPSVYSKEDVNSLLESLKNNVLDEVATLNTTPGITEEQFQVFNANVRHRLESSMCNGSIDLYDYSSAEFSIGYDNRIEIENIDFNSDAITDELDDIMLAEFQESFGFLITKTEE